MIWCRRYKLIYLLLFIGYSLYGVLMFRVGLNRRIDDSILAGDIQMEEQPLVAVMQQAPASVSKSVAASSSNSPQPTTLKSEASNLLSSIESRLIERQLERNRRITDVCSVRLSIPANSTNHIRRRKLLKSLDGKDGLPDPREFANIRVLEERRILYCEVPDVTYNTHWKRILVYLTGKSKAASPNELDPYDVHVKLSDQYIPRLSSYRPNEIKHRLSTYFKFMFVRDPLDRLRSTYVDKFSLGDNTLFNKQFGTKIIAMYRPHASNKSLTFGHDVQHHEFVKYLIDPRTTDVEKVHDHYYAMEPHWRSVDNLCHPCYVGYNFIGHHETMNEDVEHATKIMGFPDMLSHFRSSAKKLSAQLNSKLKKKPLTSSVENGSKVAGYADVPASDVQKLVELYDDDFWLFGYPYPSGLNDKMEKT